jgi:predicted ATPase
VLATGAVRVRMGLHTGEPLLTGEGYAGRELHRAARIASSGHGGQIVLSAATRELVGGDDLVELGEHRLRDFSEPVPLFQLGRERFPPLKTISNTNLPRPASSFVGRRRERDELVGLLRDGARLVTLSGPGGSGKTRLAIEAATELVPEFKAGVFWVGLAALREPVLVTEMIAQTLGAKDGLAGHVGERELLLVLDNFEQLVEAAPDLGELLESCPHLKLLVTSREVLRIRGEVEYPVPPLEESEGVELFCERSRLEPEEAIGELCRRLDELPLALELAAARTSVLSPAQILDRLGQRLDLLRGGRDVEARQQTLRSMIEWSHDLLDEAEKRLFARLAVFAGGCTLDAAQEICEADLDVLQSLVEKSLLRHSGDRFWMLETIREFAVEQLQSRPDAGRTPKRHANWYSQFAATGRPALEAGGQVQPEWVARLDPEFENIRSAIDWARHNDPQLEAELVGTAWYFLAERGLFREASGWLADALETAQAAPSVDPTRVRWGAAYVALRMGDYAAAKQWSEQNLALFRARRDIKSVAWSLVGLAIVATQQNERERSKALLLEAAELAQDCEDRQILEQMIAYNLGDLALLEGDLETARANFRQTADKASEVSDDGGEAFGLMGLSAVALAQQDPADAAALLAPALRIAGDLKLPELIYGCLLGLAEVAAQRNEPIRAARLLAATAGLSEEMGYRPGPSEREQHARVAAVLDADDSARVPRPEEHAQTLEEAVAYALGGVGGETR